MSSGGGGTTTVSGFPKEFRPYAEKGLQYGQTIMDRKMTGQEPIVAPFTQSQEKALAAKERVGEMKMAGTGAYNTQDSNRRDLENLWGINKLKASTAGSGGSARSNRAIASGLADRQREYDADRQRFIDEGMKDVYDAGLTRQKQRQAYYDAPWSPVEKFSGVLHGFAPKEQRQTGGGK